MAGVLYVSRMESLQLVHDAMDLAAVRRLFGEYRRAVEGFASAADVCA
jgi:hypothetical protein